MVEEEVGVDLVLFSPSSCLSAFSKNYSGKQKGNR